MQLLLFFNKRKTKEIINNKLTRFGPACSSKPAERPQ